MNIQPHTEIITNQAPPMLDQLVWSAVSVGFGLLVGVVLGIVIGVHLLGRRSHSTLTTPASPAPATHAVPASVARVPQLAAPEHLVLVREYVHEVTAGSPLASRQLDYARPEVTR